MGAEQLHAHCQQGGSRGRRGERGTLNNCIVYYNTAMQERGQLLSRHLQLNRDFYQSLLHDATSARRRGQHQCRTTISQRLAPECRFALPRERQPRVCHRTGHRWGNLGQPSFHRLRRIPSRRGHRAIERVIQAAYTNVIMGFAVNFTAAIDGRATASRWEFGDGTVVSNQPDTSHSWAMAGDYSVVLQAYNEPTRAELAQRSLSMWWHSRSIMSRWTAPTRRRPTRVGPRPPPISRMRLMRPVQGRRCW